MKTPARPLLFAALLCLSAFPICAARSAADDKMPGEATDLTDEVRAKAEKLIDTLEHAKEAEESLKARRGLLALGPVVWPVIENAMRLVPPEASKPHLYFLKAMLSKKTEPEFDYFRARVRRAFLTGGLDSIQGEMAAFRLGRPDPAKPSKKIPPTCKATMAGVVAVFRSGDGSLVLAFGPDGTEKAPDAADVGVTEAMAGFVAALGGKPKPAAHTSGRAGAVNVTAPMGFAFAWAQNGADGVRPGGSGGDAGSCEAKGGAGTHAHAGAAGAGAPGG